MTDTSTEAVEVMAKRLLGWKPPEKPFAVTTEMLKQMTEAASLLRALAVERDDLQTLLAGLMPELKRARAAAFKEAAERLEDGARVETSIKRAELLMSAAKEVLLLAQKDQP